MTPLIGKRVSATAMVLFSEGAVWFSVMHIYVVYNNINFRSNIIS